MFVIPASLVNSRHAGGCRFCPPLEYSRLVKYYVRYRHQTFSTLSDINLTPCLEILSNLVGKFLRKLRFSDVMSCDFELKMVVSYIDRRLMYAEANHKKGVKTKEIEFSTRWLSRIFKIVGF